MIEPHAELDIVSNQTRPVVKEDGSICDVLLDRESAGLSGIDTCLVRSIPVYGVDPRVVEKRWYSLKDVQSYHKQESTKDGGEWSLSVLESFRRLKLQVAQYNHMRMPKEIVEHELDLHS